MAAHAPSVLPVSSSTSLILRKPTKHSSSLKLDNQVNRFFGEKVCVRLSNLGILASKRHVSTVATASFSHPTSKEKGAAFDGKPPRWSARAIKSIAMAELEARKLKYPNTGTEALLMGILVEGTSLAAKFLRENGITLFKVREETVKLLGKADMFFFSPEHPPLTEPAQRALGWAVEEKSKSGESGEVTTTCLILGIWSQKESAGHKIMAAFGFDDEKAKELAKNMDTGGCGGGSRMHMLRESKRGFAEKGNVEVVTAGTVALLSVILITVIHPIVVSPAFASFLSAAKTGGPAAAGGPLLRSAVLNSAWTGFFAGCLHTLSGPDHLAALAPLSIGRTRIESAVVGALWGCGHDAGQMIFGLLFLLLKDRLHIEIIRTWGTRVVGFTLMVIGAMGIREASEVPTPCVALENGECDVSMYEGLENPTIGKKKIGFATFSTGIVHGLQPDALIVILPALALPSRLASAAFLFMFLVGTIIAMGSYTVLIGSCSQALKERIPRITEKLTWGSSLIAIALGFAIVISQFFGFNLY